MLPFKKSTLSKVRIHWVSAASKRRLAVFGAIFGGLGGYILLSSSSAVTAPPSIYMTPASGTYAANATITVEVRANSDTTAVNAVGANFTYPANLLEYVSVDTTQSAFTVEAPSAANGNGAVHIARGLVAGISGDRLIAKVTFRALADTTGAQLTFTDGTELHSASGAGDLILADRSNAYGATFKIDASPPVIAVTSPAANAKVAAGSTVTVSATATDAISTVSAAELWVDGARIATKATAPYTFTWSTVGLSLNSAHSIQVRATDSFGNAGQSPAVPVTVADLTPPTAAISAPAANALVRGGAVPVSVTAADPAGGSGLAKAELYVGGVLTATDTSVPYSFIWDTTAAPDGNRSLYAKVYDAAPTPNVTTSSTVTAKVDNTPPSAPGGLAAGTVTFNSVALSWAASTDTNGIASYRISKGATVLGTVPAATRAFTATNLAASTQHTLSVVAVDAAGNASAASTVTVTTGAGKLGDITGPGGIPDGVVGLQDLSALFSNWGKPGAGDFDNSGTAGLSDMSILFTNWTR